MPILGLHHVTATVDEAQDDLDFCLHGLGLRLVKKTVNFDNHHVYHFYYGDQRGTPGTIWTTFPYSGRGVAVGTKGAGQVTVTSFSVPIGAFDFWRVHLGARGVAVTDIEPRFGEAAIRFSDLSGLAFELVATDRDARSPWISRAVDGFDASTAIRGLHSVTLIVRDPPKTIELMTTNRGYVVVDRTDPRARPAGVHRSGSDRRAGPRVEAAAVGRTESRRHRGGAADNHSAKAALTARGESLAAFDGRCIPAGCVAPRSNTPGIAPHRAQHARWGPRRSVVAPFDTGVPSAAAALGWSSGRLARLGATPAFHHGLLVLAFSLFAGCATNPVTGKRELSLMSEAQEIQIGQQQDADVRKEMGVYNDRALQEYVTTLGLKLAQVSERPNLPWHFTVLDVPAINAFALPGGYIYITRGILPFLDDEAQLAGVLGHEIGHVTARHSAQQYSRATGAQLGLILGSILVPQTRPFAQLGESGLGLLFLKYSRDDEEQADALGGKYA